MSLASAGFQEFTGPAFELLRIMSFNIACFVGIKKLCG
jgi:hypothetical protein